MSAKGKQTVPGVDSAMVSRAQVSVTANTDYGRLHTVSFLQRQRKASDHCRTPHLQAFHEKVRPGLARKSLQLPSERRMKVFAVHERSSTDSLLPSNANGYDRAWQPMNKVCGAVDWINYPAWRYLLA